MSTNNDETEKFFSEKNARRLIVAGLGLICTYIYNGLTDYKQKVDELLEFRNRTEGTRFTKEDATELSATLREQISALDKKVSRNEEAIDDIPKEVPPKWFERLVYRLQEQMDKVGEVLRHVLAEIAELKGQRKK